MASAFSEVDTLVLRLIQQLVNATVIVFHLMQRTQVLKCSTHHARNCGDRFQYHRAMSVSMSKERIGKEPKEANERIGRPI